MRWEARGVLAGAPKSLSSRLTTGCTKGVGLTEPCFKALRKAYGELVPPHLRKLWTFPSESVGRGRGAERTRTGCHLAGTAPKAGGRGCPARGISRLQATGEIRHLGPWGAQESSVPPGQGSVLGASVGVALGSLESWAFLVQSGWEVGECCLWQSSVPGADTASALSPLTGKQVTQGSTLWLERCRHGALLLPACD